MNAILKKALPYIVALVLVLPAIIGGELDWTGAIKKIVNPKAAVVDCTATLEGTASAETIAKQIEAGAVNPAEAIKE